ncbi:MAG: MFS transporter [Eubacteriales bacterium]|nr:MFS transporter [Eubacteriales bacterium]
MSCKFEGKSQDKSAGRMEETVLTNKQSYSFNDKLIVMVCYASLAMLGIYISLYQYTILSISQLYLLNAAMMGMLIAMQHFGMCFPPLFIGKLCFTVGKKRVLQLSFGLIILGTFLVGFTGSFIAFVISVFLIGAGYSVTEATMSAVLTDEFPEDSKKHLSFSQVAFSIGAFVGPFVAETLINAGIYFKDLYIYVSIMFLILGIIMTVTRYSNDKGQSEDGLDFNLVRFLKNKVILLLVLCVFLYVGIENTIANYADSYFEIIREKPGLSAAALSLFWGAMIPSRFLAGVVKIETKKVFIYLSSLVAVACVAAMLIPDNSVKLMMFTLAGFGCGPLWPLVMNVVAEKNKGATGPSMNVMMAFSGLGGATLPFISGIVINYSNQTAAYYLCAIAAVMLLFVYLASLKKGAKKQGAKANK